MTTWGSLELIAPPASPAGIPTPSGARSPVLLVHGFDGAPGQWFLVQRVLRQAGFRSVRTLDHDPRRADVPALAELLCRTVRNLLAETGSSRVHLVGHGLGGVVIRYAVTVLGLDPLVDGAVTIASPHEGAPVAWAGAGRAAADVRPGSELLRRLETAAAPGHARWVAFACGFDALVPADRARIDPPALRARNVVLHAEGHLSVLFSPTAADAVAAHLATVAPVAAPGSATGAVEPRAHRAHQARLAA